MITLEPNSTNRTTDLMLNLQDANNTATNCTNDYCVSEEDYLDIIANYVFWPSVLEWILIVLHALVFVVGLVGNFLVCVAVYRNQTMRTVTNYFIVNLAVADFFVILVCLPPTVLWDVTETWFFGDLLCKAFPYIQSVSVSVSVMTLTFISMDRWYAICFPLKFKSTTTKAKSAILLIWLTSLVFVLPELLVLETRPSPRLKFHTHYLTECTHTWSDSNQKTYQIILLLLMYVFPFTLMSVAYYQIVRVLWTSDFPGSRESQYITTSTSCKSLTSNNTLSRHNAATEGQIRSRRKAAKMLIAVVAMFGMCYFPVHLLSVLRYTVGLPQNQGTTALSMISHWVVYANSSMNPVIYNFMSGKFRYEFKMAFRCQCSRSDYSNRNGTRTGRNTTYLCHYTSTLTHVDVVNLTEMTPTANGP